MGSMDFRLSQKEEKSLKSNAREQLLSSGHRWSGDLKDTESKQIPSKHWQMKVKTYLLDSGNHW